MKGNGLLHENAYKVLQDLGMSWYAEALWSHCNNVPDEHMLRVEHVFSDVLNSVIEFKVVHNQKVLVEV